MIKGIITALVICLLPMIGAAQIDSDHMKIKPGEKVEVVFDNRLTEADLDNMQFILKGYDIWITYTDRKYDNKGKLTSIEFSVDCRDGHQGETSGEALSKKNKIGFVRDYKGKDPFTIGKL